MKYNNNIKDGSYGIELIMDLHECDKELFTEDSLKIFVKELIKITKMQAYGNPIIWTDHNSSEPHLKGISIFQFIVTSNITIHTMELTGLVMINLFTCKDFDANVAITFSEEFFKPSKIDSKIIQRGKS